MASRDEKLSSIGHLSSMGDLSCMDDLPSIADLRSVADQPSTVSRDKNGSVERRDTVDCNRVKTVRSDSEFFACPIQELNVKLSAIEIDDISFDPLTLEALYGRLRLKFPPLDKSVRDSQKDNYFLVNTVSKTPSTPQVTNEVDKNKYSFEIATVIDRMRDLSRSAEPIMMNYQAAVLKEIDSERVFQLTHSYHHDYQAVYNKWIKDSLEVARLRVPLNSAIIERTGLEQYLEKLQEILGEEATYDRWLRLQQSKDKNDTATLVTEVSNSTWEQLQDIFQVWTIPDFAKFPTKTKMTMIHILRDGEWQTSDWFVEHLLADICVSNNDILRFVLKGDFAPYYKQFWGCKPYEIVDDMLETKKKLIDLLKKKRINSPKGKTNLFLERQLFALLLYKPAKPDPNRVCFKPRAKIIGRVRSIDLRSASTGHIVIY